MKRILLGLITLGAGLAAFAQWNGSPSVGTQISTATAASSKTNIAAVSDGAGGMFVGWIDGRTGSTPTIFLQRILPGGTVKFGSDVVVSNAAGTTSSAKANLYMIPDGAGGVICAWQDSRNFSVAFPSNNDVYGQRVDANGNVLWSPNGVRLSVADNTMSSKITPVVDVVSATEAIVVFGDSRNGSVDLFAQKILLTTGATQWNNDASLHGNVTGTQNQQQVAADGNGGVYVVWQDQRSGGSSADVYATRIDKDGAIVSGWGTNGTAVAAGNFIQFQPQLLSLGSAGFITTWADNRSAAGQTEIYAQRFSGSGATQWTPSPAGGAGVLIADNVTTTVQSNPFILASGSSYSIIVWSDQRNGTSNRDIYAQRIDNSSGAYQWTQYGVQLVGVGGANGNQPSSSTQSGISIVSDGSDGAIVVWDDGRISSTDREIYAQRVSSAGARLWGDNGAPVSTVTGSNQQSPVAVQGANGTALVAWQDSRNGNANSEIYAARLQPNGVLPLHSLNLLANAKTASIDVKWSTVNESNTASFVVEKSADGASFQPIGSVKAAGFGNGNYALEDNRPAKGLNYFRIKAVDQNKAFSYSAVVAVNFGGLAMASLFVYPNPATQTATVQLANLANGNYTLSLYSPGGQEVWRKAMAVSGQYTQAQVSLSGLTAGAYLLRVTAGGQTLFSTMLQKQ